MFSVLKMKNVLPMFAFRLMHTCVTHVIKEMERTTCCFVMDVMMPITLTVSFLQ